MTDDPQSPELATRVRTLLPELMPRSLGGLVERMESVVIGAVDEAFYAGYDDLFRERWAAVKVANLQRGWLSRAVIALQLAIGDSGAGGDLRSSTDVQSAIAQLEEERRLMEGQATALSEDIDQRLEAMGTRRLEATICVSAMHTVLSVISAPELLSPRALQFRERLCQWVGGGMIDSADARHVAALSQFLIEYFQIGGKTITDDLATVFAVFLIKSQLKRLCPEEEMTHE